LVVIGIDTNVIVRLIVNDDERQSRAAERFIQEHCSAESPAYVSNVVLAETVWVLETVYGYDRAGVADALTLCLEVEQIEFDSPADIAAAIEDFRRGQVEFVDCLIGRTNLFDGCEYTATFDRKASQLTGFQLLKAR
jgi:predicted nucleic-acid-binding protein